MNEMEKILSLQIPPVSADTSGSREITRISPRALYSYALLFF